MENKIIKRFVLSTKEDFETALGAIACDRLNVDIHTDRENFTIELEFHKEDDTTLKHMYDYAARKEIIVKDVPSHQQYNMHDVENLIFQRDEAQNGLLKMTEERDTYCNWWKESKKECDRVKTQIKSIAALMNSIFPNVTNGALE